MLHRWQVQTDAAGAICVFKERGEIGTTSDGESVTRTREDTRLPETNYDRHNRNDVSIRASMTVTKLI